MPWPQNVAAHTLGDFLLSKQGLKKYINDIETKVKNRLLAKIESFQQLAL